MPLAFGPGGSPPARVSWLAPVRVGGVLLLIWGFLTALANGPPRFASLREAATDEEPRVVILLDVSPSMDIEDAGPAENMSRRSWGATVLWQRLSRMPAGQVRISVVAFYTSAKPIVVDARDPGLIRHLLYAVPLRQVFEHGITYLGPGLEAVTDLVRDWPPRSASLIVLTDGGDVEPQAVARPPAIKDVWVVGVGSQHGILHDGQPSFQECACLKEIADHLGGIYNNCNGAEADERMLEPLWHYFQAAAGRPSRRRTAALAALFGGVLLSAVPLMLTRWGRKARP
jgi:Ca-activated chloride channel family protein